MAFGGVRGTLSVSLSSVTNPTNLSGSVSVSLDDLVFVNFSELTNLTAGTVTDNLGNTYTALSAGTDAGGMTCRAYYSLVTVAGTLTQIQVAATASADDAVGVAVVFQGPFDASPLDANPTPVSNDTTSPYSGPATGVLNANKELIVSYAAVADFFAGSFDWTANSPNVLQILTAVSGSMSAAIGSQVVTSTSSVQPSWTNSFGGPSSDVIGTASFKAAPTGSASGVGTASGVGASTNASTGSASGVGAAAGKSVNVAFVGSVQTSAINGGDIVHDLSGLGLQKDDFILVASCAVNRAGNEGIVTSPSGYNFVGPFTLVNRSYVVSKFWDSADGTSITVLGTGNAADGMSSLVFVFRGVDTTRPMSAWPNWFFVNSSGVPQGNNITPSDDNACLVVFAMSSVIDSTPGTITNFTHPSPSQSTADDTSDAMVAGAYRVLSGGKDVNVLPAAWSSWTATTYISYTLALRPAGSPAWTEGKYIGRALYQTGNFTNAGMQSVYNYVAVGDLLVASMEIASAPPADSNVSWTDSLGNTWTKLDSSNTTQSLYMAYCCVTIAGWLSPIVSFPSQAGTKAVGWMHFLGVFDSLNPLDKNPASSLDASGTTHNCPATGTLTNASELVVCACGSVTSSTWGATSPMLAIYDGGNLGVAYKIVSVVTDTTPQLTTSGSVGCRKGTATFKMHFTTDGVGDADGASSASAVGASTNAVVGSAGATSVAQGISFYFASAANTLRPDADADIGGWQDELANNTNLFDSLDEAPPDLTDYITTGDRVTVDAVKLRLSNPDSTPQEPMAIYVKYQKSAQSSYAAGDPYDLIVKLYQGAVLIATRTISDIAATPTTTPLFLTSPEFASISDFTDLYIEFTVTKVP